eukprot:scaffold211187_cov17-Tisochrysis_lutea.AAC.1
MESVKSGVAPVVHGSMLQPVTSMMWCLRANSCTGVWCGVVVTVTGLAAATACHILKGRVVMLAD